VNQKIPVAIPGNAVLMVAVAEKMADVQVNVEILALAVALVSLFFLQANTIMVQIKTADALHVIFRWFINFRWV
jgi:hypothetical protein